MTDCFQSLTRCFEWLFGIQINEVVPNSWTNSNDDSEYSCDPESCMYARDIDELNCMLDTIKDEHTQIVTEVDWYLAQQKKDMCDKSTITSRCVSEYSEESYSSEEDEEDQDAAPSMRPY